MKYGLPYKGSKNKLAERIVRLLPRRTHLVDLFCGGCAVSHAALVMGKYEHIHINDNNWMCPTLFMDALAGKYNDEKRWISREDFFRLRDTDPYVAVVWSFGNNLRDYLYSQEIEPLKKAIHYAIFFSDYSLGKELGHDLSFIDGVSDVQKRYLLIKRQFSQFGHFQQQSFFGGQMQGEHYARKQRLSQIGAEFSRHQSAESNVRLNTNLQNWGGYAAHPQDWRQPKDCSISLGIPPSRTHNGGAFSQTTFKFATHGLQTPDCSNSKKMQATLGKPTRSEPTALHRLQYRERQHCLPTISGGGGKHCRLHPVCLTMPTWRYLATA